MQFSSMNMPMTHITVLISTKAVHIGDLHVPLPEDTFVLNLTLLIAKNERTRKLLINPYS